MKLSKRQLRRIIRESIMKVSITKPGNPWMSDKYEVDGNLAQQIADELADACEGYDYSASYNYDRHVEPVLQKHLAKIDHHGEQRALIRAVELKLNKMSDYSDFHQGANAARKCVQTFSAYQTPGFSKARRVSDYGYDPTER